ncbi:MAG: restriction endonuclease subunit S [Verrucomicrobiales bacterium]|nr:restriction endonuclease subunit S [Verrucomicrobiales bacterium]
MNLPSGWKQVTLGEATAATRLGGNYECNGTYLGIPVIKMGNLGRGRIQLATVERMPEGADYFSDDVLKRGDILFNTRNTLDLVGKVAMWREELPRAVFNSNILRIDFDESRGFTKGFGNLILNSRRAIMQLRAIATGTTSVAAIYWRDAQHIRLLRPPLEEQEKISSIIESWNNAILKLESFVAAKVERKRGLMQQLVTGQTRFKEFVRSDKKVKTRFGNFPADWSQVHMGDIADEAGKKNGGGRELPVLSCTKYRGLVNSLEYFGKRIFSEDTSTYRIVERGDFAYATNHIEEGSIGYQNLHDAALISPMYTVFRTKPGVDHEFFWKLIKTELYRHIFEVNTSGSIARRGALRWDEFALIKVFLPTVPEQKRIAAVLNTCDEEIKLLEKQLEALKEQKRGLMQKLLTGEVRVKI